MLAPIGLQHYIVLAATLFCLGVMTMIVKRNAIGILIGVELILNAAGLNMVAFNRYRTGAGEGILLDGQVFALFVIVLAAAEAAVAIAIFMNYYNSIGSVDVDQASRLRG